MRGSSSPDEVIESSLMNKSFNRISKKAIILGIVIVVIMIEVVPHRIAAFRLRPHLRRLGELRVDLH